MEKIRLNDGTVLEIQDGAKEYEVTIPTSSVDEVAAHFTDENLERYEILTENDAVCAIYTKKHLKKLSAVAADEGYLVTLTLTDRDEIYEKLTSIEEKLNSLVAVQTTEDVEETVEPEEPTETEEPTEA